MDTIRLQRSHCLLERRCKHPLLAVCCMLLLSACAHSHPTLVVNREIAFDEFISSVRAAKLEDFTKASHARVESAAAFEEMKKHILFLYEGVTPKHTFLGRDNQFVDCVPIEQQAALRNPRIGPLSLQLDPPKPALPSHVSDDRMPGNVRLPDQRRMADITLKEGVRDSFGKEMYCTPRTIPMRRITLEEMTRFRTLNDFFAKGGRVNARTEANVRRGELLPGDSSHYYAVGYQNIANFGGDSWLNLWSPRVSTHQMSLSQIWVRANPDDNKQTVEAGWQVYPDKWSNAQAALFIYYTTRGYQDGCYNLDCAGFVQTANNVYLGAGFDHSSQRDGAQWGFNLQVKRHTDGNWWLFYRGPGEYIAFGYYPGSLYGDGEMSRQASIIRWGGEDTGEPSACQMGSGAFPSEGWGKAAFHDTAFYIDTNTVSQWPTLSKIEIPGDCYRIDIHNFSDNRQKTSLFFGGPKCN